MANESFSISEVIPARPERIYAAWMNSEEHSAFTGDAASVDAVPGGPHSSFSGYARGVNIELHEGRRIVQTWRTTQFPSESPDSRLEVTLEETVGGTMLTIFHSDIPAGQSTSYRQSWEKYYLDALKRYFNSGVEAPAVATEDPTLTDIPVKKVVKMAHTAAPKSGTKSEAKARAKSGTKSRAKTATSRNVSKVAKKRGGKSAKKPGKKPGKKPARTAARRAKPARVAAKKPGKGTKKRAAATKGKKKTARPSRRGAKKRR
ncbi:MAG TPA: SRPBCC domain-containing protein [Polyangia bacterium]|nr:SRPBCC domain-containing protein [Polyangia bacterium]